MSKRKILQTSLLLLILCTTLVSWASYRIALATDESEEIVITTEEQVDTEETSETNSEELAEASTEITEEVVTSETSTEVIVENVSEITEEYISEQTIEVSSTTETTTEQTTEELTEDIPVITDGETTLVNTLEMDDEVEQFSATEGTVHGNVSWGTGHWYWAVTSSGTTNVAFCIDQGKKMNQKWEVKKYTSEEDCISGDKARRVNIAVLWYKEKAGSLKYSSLDGSAYQSAQMFIWGDDDYNTDTKELAKHLKHGKSIASKSTLGMMKKKWSDGSAKDFSKNFTEKTNEKTWKWSCTLIDSNDMIKFFKSNGYTVKASYSADATTLANCGGVKVTVLTS